MSSEERIAIALERIADAMEKQNVGKNWTNDVSVTLVVNLKKISELITAGEDIETAVKGNVGVL